MKIFKSFILFIYINLIRNIISIKYPFNQDLDNITGTQDLIEIETRSSYVNYTKYNKAISIFHTNFCRYCYYLIEVFKWASSYSKVSDWKFLSVNCTRKQLICKFYNITKLPTIKTYINNRTELPYEAPYELIPLIEYLIKLSTPPLIEIIENSTNSNNFQINNVSYFSNYSNISDFYKNFGYFSPIAEYNPDKKEFYDCITNLANNKHRANFYFGMKKIKNDTKEKIIIDNDGAPFSYSWDGNCTNIDLFLDKNLFPLVTIITENIFFYKLNKRKELLVMLFGYLKNNKTNNFINNEYKFLAHKNHKLRFCFLNYTNTSEINRYFSVKLYTKSELKLVIFDFSKFLYYIHPIVYDLNYNNPDEIYNDFDKVLKNLSEIQFTTGYFFKDLMIKFGFNEFTTSLSIGIACSSILLTILICFACISFCNKFCPSEIEDSEEIELKKDYKNNEENKKKVNNDKEIKLKKE